MKRTAAFIAIPVGALAIFASGCGGTSDTVATAPSTESATRSASATRTECASELYRCVRLSIANESGGWIRVMANGYDQGQADFGIGAGSKGSVTGYRGSWGNRDITGEIWDTDRDPRYHYFQARNPQVGRPSVAFWSGSDANRNVKALSVGETVSFPVMKNRKFVVTRNGDSNNFIEFAVKYDKGN